MSNFVKIFLYGLITFAVITGVVLLIRGKIQRKLSKNHYVYYEGFIVRLFGLYSIVLGLFTGAIMILPISKSVLFVASLLLVFTGGVIGIFFQKAGVIKDK